MEAAVDKKFQISLTYFYSLSICDKLTLGVKFTLAPLFSSSWATLIFS